MKPALGVCYYPEHWDEAVWADDAKRMVETGLQWVRIGEFAWSRLEASEGVFSFEWLDRAIEILGQAGLKIVLGTPTATPPHWVVAKYPDMLAMDKEGRVRGFGSRRHYDFSHLGYRQEAARITEVMAQRYAGNAHLGFWQLDNEYSCHDTTLSYSPSALAGFQAWLQTRYSYIQALNQAWGNVFWSMEYSDFAEIGLPNLTVTEANPSHWLDFRRYSSDQVVAFNQAMVDAVRKHDQSTPILHNYMGKTTDFDHFAVGDSLDAGSWDSYPLGFLEDRVRADDAWKNAFMRQGDPDFQAFHHDLYRAVGKGRWWVMEQQPGPVNWAPYNPVPLAGMVRLWAWEAFAHGAEVVSYFRWRQAPFAQEQMHAGLLRPDSEASFALAEVQQVAKELAELGEVSTQTAPVAIVFDYESQWAWDTQPQGRGFDYFQLVLEQYQALRRLGLSIDICPPTTQDFSAYKLVLVPTLMHWKHDLKTVLKTCQGLVVLGPRTGSKTQDFQIPKSLPPDCDELIDIKVKQVESLRPAYQLALQGGGYIQHWREYLKLGKEVEVVSNATDDEAVIVRQGNVIYCAAWLDAEGYKTLYQNLCTEVSLPMVELPDGLRLRQLGDKVIAINYAGKEQDLSGLSRVYKFKDGMVSAANISIGSYA
ncbi:MAG: beta-galactosidase [Thiolinea sp.]